MSWNFKACSQYDTDTDKELCDTEAVSLRTFLCSDCIGKGAAADREGPEHSCSAEMCNRVTLLFRCATVAVLRKAFCLGGQSLYPVYFSVASRHKAAVIF